MRNCINLFKNLNIDNIFLYAVRYDIATVFILSVLTGLIWYFTEPIIFTYDSFGYLDTSKAFAGMKDTGPLYWRAPLFPILLALTGVPTLQTFNYFLIAQLLLGIATIMVMHNCLRNISRPLGLLGSLLFITTFMAFVHSKSVMTEQIYLFGWCLCIDALLAYIKKGSRLRLAELILSFVILAMSRAQGAFIALLLLPLLACYMPKKIPELLIGAVTFFLITLGYSSIHPQEISIRAGKKMDNTISGLGITHSTGKMLFMVAYWDPYKHFGWTLVHPKNGPASEQLFSELKKYYSDPSHLPANLNYELFSQFIGHPEDLVKTIENHPDAQYWWEIWRIMDVCIGPSNANNLLMKVTIETMISNPLEMLSVYLRNFAVALAKADSSYVWQHKSFDARSVGDHFAKEIKNNGNSEQFTTLSTFLNLYFPFLQILLLFANCFVVVRVWKSSWRIPFLFCIVLLLYNHATVAIAATPESRYTFYAFPLLLSTIIMGIMASRNKQSEQSLMNFSFSHIQKTFRAAENR